MRVKEGFMITLMISTVLFGCMAVAAGATFGICWKSILGGVLCMVLQWVVGIAAALAFCPKYMRSHDGDTLREELNERL